MTAQKTTDPTAPAGCTMEGDRARGAFNTGAIGAMHRGPLHRRAPVWENSEL